MEPKQEDALLSPATQPQVTMKQITVETLPCKRKITRWWRRERMCWEALRWCVEILCVFDTPPPLNTRTLSEELKTGILSTRWVTRAANPIIPGVYSAVITVWVSIVDPAGIFTVAFALDRSQAANTLFVALVLTATPIGNSSDRKLPIITFKLSSVTLSPCLCGFPVGALVSSHNM